MSFWGIVAKIFVSYTASDSAWAQWLGRELRALGHEPFVHEWEIGAGESIQAWMAARHDEADHVLCVLSDAYLSDEASFSRLEREAALWQSAGKRPGFALLVPVRPCRLPTLIDHMRCCEPLHGVDEEEARRRFQAYMAQREAPHAALFPGRAVAVSNIATRVPAHFVGRDDVLDDIDAAFARVEGRPGIVVLHGLRGIGKTTLAAAYAERRRAEYRATWWVRARNPATLRADLAGLAARLGLAGADEPDEVAALRLGERLRHEGDGVLLVFDDAPDAAALRPHLPPAGGVRVIVTSNAHAWRGIAQPLERRLWPAGTGAEYLMARTGRDEAQAALDLSAALGGLPLAHEQAAAYCERLDLPLADYLRRFATAPGKLLDAEKDSPAEYRDGLTVAKAFALAIEEAGRLDPVAGPLIAAAARLAPEPIPLALFEAGRVVLGGPQAGGLDEDGLLEAVAALRSFALVERESVADERDPAVTSDCIRLHRLVRQVAAGRPGPAAGALLRAVLALYPVDVFSDSRTWPLARRLDPHAEQLVADMEAGTDEPALAELMSRLGLFRAARADLGRARELLERALALRERIFGDHPDTAKAADNLASVILAQGDPAAARPHARRALALRERLLPEDHPDLGASLGNGALVMRALGSLATARQMTERALAIFETALGGGHPTTVRMQGNLALVLMELGEAQAALPLCEAVLRARETLLGEDHAETALALHNLAHARHEAGQLAAARTAYGKALALRERLFGPDHPETAQTLANLAGLDADEGDLDGARARLERVRTVQEAAFGPGHPLVAATLCNIGALARRSGELARAVAILERACAAFEAALGAGHSATLGARVDLAEALLAHEEPERALGLAEAMTGADPPVLAEESLARVAALQAEALDALGRREEAGRVRRRYPQPEVQREDAK